MSGITSALHEHHKHCDNDFATTEEAAQRGDWAGCAALFARFRDELLGHFGIEEDALFPAFEQQTGMTGGPTEVMRGEHAQMRRLLLQMEEALAQQNTDDFGGAADTLLMMMQQHNMKEENILYPMCDQALSADSALQAKIEAGLKV